MQTEKMIRAPYEGKPHVRCDEGVLETGKILPRQRSTLPVVRGKLTIVEELLDKAAASIYTKNEKGDTLLHMAVIHDQVDVLIALLKRGIARNLRNQDKLTALELATKLNKQTAIDLLTQNKPLTLLSPIDDTPDAKKRADKKRKLEEENKTSYNQQQDIAKAILSDVALNKKPKSALVDHDNQQVDRSIQTITAIDKLPVLSQSLESNISLSIDVLSDWTTNGNLFRLKQAITGEFIRRCDARGDTLLHIAVKANQLACVKFLIEQGAEINRKNADDFTPFYLLLADLSEGLTENTANYRLKMDIAYLLVQQGAYVNLPMTENKLSRDGLTALHIVVAYNQYRLMKIILSAPDCNPNLPDSKGWGVLHWAIYQNNIEMLARLLIDRRLETKTVEVALAFAKQTLEKKDHEIIQLLQEPQASKLPPTESGIQWIKKFSVIYGSRYAKTRKALTINAEKEHAQLALQNAFSTKRLFNPGEVNQQDEIKNFPGNPVTASLTFITSVQRYKSGENHERQKIRVSLDFIEDYHVSGDGNVEFSPEEIKQRIIQRVMAAPKDISKAFAGSPNQPHDIQSIEALYQAAQTGNDPNYQLAFHHGEQALLNYLEHDANLETIVNKLLKTEKFTRGCKVYGIVLDIHSPRYACENCQVGILGEQNSEQSVFLKLLRNKLITIGCTLPHYSSLKMVTQISSYMPFHSAPISEQEHQSLTIDLRACTNNLILAKDLSEVTSKATQYHSTKPKL